MLDCSTRACARTLVYGISTRLRSFFPSLPPLDIAIGVEHAKDKAKMVAEAITAAVALVDPLIGTF